MCEFYLEEIPTTLSPGEALLPHLDVAYNLARWLTRNDHDAEDVVQESYLRALKSFGRFHGSNARPWLLKIVRNTCYTWLRRNRSQQSMEEFDQTILSKESDLPDPETSAVAKSQQQQVAQALNNLPAEFREVLVLREFEELSYKEIADVAGVPVGTVMSRLARARKKLRASILSEHFTGLALESTVVSARSTWSKTQLAVD